MHRTSLLAVATMFSFVACTSAVDTPEPGTNVAPPLSAEDQAIVSQLESRKLAEVPLAEGKVSFYEVEPGEFVATSTFPIGAQTPKLPNEGSLIDAFRAVAPDREVPEAIVKAVERAQTLQLQPEVEPAASTVAARFSGARLEQPSPTATDDVEQRTSALTSVIDWNWFYGTFCAGYSGPFQATWCMAQAWTTGWASYTTHRSNSVMCGDTGPGRLRMKRSGSTLHLTDFAQGQCVGYWYHGPHDILGGSLKRTVEYIVDYAYDTVRFAGYFVSGDQFIAVPPGF